MYKSELFIMRLHQLSRVIDARSPRSQVASGLNGGYEKRVCRPESRTGYRAERTSHAEVARLAWHLAGGIGSIR